MTTAILLLLAAQPGGPMIHPGYGAWAVLLCLSTPFLFLAVAGAIAYFRAGDL